MEYGGVGSQKQLLNKMSISAKWLYLLHCPFKRLTKNYIQSIPACKEQSFDSLSQYDDGICDCLSENRPSSHLPVFREIPF